MAVGKVQRAKGCGHKVPHERNRLTLYMAHRGELVRYASGIVGDAARAEEVVQEAWLRFGAEAKGQLLEEPVGYLYRVVRNLAIDCYRQRMRERRYVEPGNSYAGRDPADDLPSPETVAVARDELRLLREAMAELPERTRIALEMRRFGGYKLREIADRLGISVTSVHDIVVEGIDYCRRRVRPDS
ncbi:MAG: sigma-70 family RNA polymerase sigma factor [Alphaproteobacteria bacterium]|nr:sigma-70 family RNA polymerase sigma factor [Alphaproteobacteria bacterium]